MDARAAHPAGDRTWSSPDRRHRAPALTVAVTLLWLATIVPLVITSSHLGPDLALMAMGLVVTGLASWPFWVADRRESHPGAFSAAWTAVVLGVIGLIALGIAAIAYTAADDKTYAGAAQGLVGVAAGGTGLLLYLGTAFVLALELLGERP